MHRIVDGTCAEWESSANYVDYNLQALAKKGNCQSAGYTAEKDHSQFKMNLSYPITTFGKALLI